MYELNVNSAAEEICIAMYSEIEIYEISMLKRGYRAIFRRRINDANPTHTKWSLTVCNPTSEAMQVMLKNGTI